MDMTKAISSAADFLSAIGQKTELFDTQGVTVELRSLEWAEAQQLNARYGNDNAELSFQTALAGIVAPKVEEAQLRKARAGVVSDIGRRVAVISGMLKEDDRPLAGSGSPSGPPTAPPT